jgi:hypothetical protein
MGIEWGGGGENTADEWKLGIVRDSYNYTFLFES